MTKHRRERDAEALQSVEAEAAIRATESDDSFVDADEALEADEERD